MPTALSTYYTTQDDVDVLLSTLGVTTRADDDASGSLSGTETAYVTRCITYATARVNLHCLQHYAAADLAGSWTVHELATVIAAVLLCKRRGNPVPDGLAEMYAEAMDTLKDLKNKALTLADAGERTSGWPTWSNLRVDHTMPLRKLRREGPISEQSRPLPGRVSSDDIAAPHIWDPQR